MTYLPPDTSLSQEGEANNTPPDALGTDPRTDYRTFCRFCVALCGLIVTFEGEQVVQITGDPDHPLSRGYACPKGRALGAFITVPTG